jgi:hypothetical protein
MKYNKFKFIYFLILFTLVYLSVFPRNVYAYIDPGSGSYLIQVILGFVFGGLFMIKIYWNKIKDKLLKRKSKGGKKEIKKTQNK